MFNNLPREILVLIGEHLDQLHPHSLLDLACVNKHCFSVLTTLLYRSLKFYVDDLESDQLGKDVTRYSQLLLQRVGGYGSVRRLIIVHTNGNEREWTAFEDQAVAEEQLRQGQHRMSPLERSGRDEDILEKYTYYPGSQTTRDTVHHTNRFWKPLAEFVSRLPSLVSIIYTSHTQFPPCLLDAIHRHNPACRLYITRFNLWSLGPRGVEDDYEAALLSSPCVHGIGAYIRASYGDRASPELKQNVYISKALRELVAGLIPHLKKLVLFQDPAPFDRSRSEPWPAWIGFGQQPDVKRGSLEYLSRNCPVRLGEKDLRMWQEDTDFSILKTLKMGSHLDSEALNFLATHCYFPSLTQLDINFDPNCYYSDDFPAANSFLLGLPALSVLRLSGYRPELATEAVFEYHGSRLHELSLLPFGFETFTLEELEQVTKTCPFLEKLTIKIKRSKGDAQEVAQYRAIGALPRLRHLYLDLDASDLELLQRPETPKENFEARNDPTFNDFDQQYCKDMLYGHGRHPRNGDLRNAFINSALDENLARGIFHTISSAQTSCMLEYMEVKVTGGGNFFFADRDEFYGRFYDVLETMGRPRRVSRMNSSSRETKVELVRGWQPSRLISSSGRTQEPSELHPFAKEIFQRVWPAKTEKWWEDWHSFPLAVSAD